MISLGVIGMIVSMPLMGGSGMAHHAAPADPLIRWMMRVIDPPVRAAIPGSMRSTHVLRYGLLVATLVAMGGASLLRPRMVRLAQHRQQPT